MDIIGDSCEPWWSLLFGVSRGLLGSQSTPKYPSAYLLLEILESPGTLHWLKLKGGLADFG